MSKIDLSKYEGMRSENSDLLRKILSDNNLKYYEILFDDLKENSGEYCINCKIKKTEVNDKREDFYSEGLNWNLYDNKVVNGVFYSDGRPLVIYKG